MPIIFKFCTKQLFCKETNHEKRKMPVYVFLLSMVFSAVPVQAAETIYVPSKWTVFFIHRRIRNFRPEMERKIQPILRMLQLQKCQI